MARAGLDRATVIDAAARVADRAGLPLVTFSGLAAELGVKPPSLYNHVASLDDLIDGVSLRGLQELADRSKDAATGRSGRDALEAIAQAHRAYAKAHPGVYAATLRSVERRNSELQAAGQALLDVLLAVLRGYHLVGNTALHSARCLHAAIRGFLALELGGGFGMPLDVDESFRRLVEMLDAGLKVAKPRVRRGAKRRPR